MIEFHLDTRSGVPTYLQLVQQVTQAIRLGILQPGDQLPTVKEVVGSLAINPNTVLKAYRELDLGGLVEGRRGQGTFVSSDLAPVAPEDVKALPRRCSAGSRARVRPDSTTRTSPRCSATRCARRRRGGRRDPRPRDRR